MKRAITLMTLLTAFGASGSAIRVSDAAVRPMSMEQLSARADRIVVGRVGNVVSRWAEWEGVGRVIVTRCTITVEESLGGGKADGLVTEIEVEVPGGTVGDLTLVVSDAPALVSGERAVFFLVADAARDCHRIYGLESGKLPLRGSRIVTNPGLVAGPCSSLEEVRRAVKAAGSR